MDELLAAVEWKLRIAEPVDEHYPSSRFDLRVLLRRQERNSQLAESDTGKSFLPARLDRGKLEKFQRKQFELELE